MTDEPPIAQPADDLVDPLSFVIGCDRAGRWIVVEGHGLYGGIFGSQRDAARYARFESGGRRSVIAMSAEPLEFYEGARRAA
jgi:hypothetical protein